MPAISASAPGKVILLGEHAVVYGRPALAVPVGQVNARAVVLPLPMAAAGSVEIFAPDIQLKARLTDLPEGDPIAKAIRLAIQELGGHVPAFQIKIVSSIPVAAGLGSGAAVSVAVLRAVSAFAGRPFADVLVNSLAFEVEKIHHGTPSGIDNTVITYNRPVYFIKGQAPKPLNPGEIFTFVIADTGIQSATGEVVGQVRQAWMDNPQKYETLFDQIGDVVNQARQAIESGQAADLGNLMDQNQVLLEEVGVSDLAIESLVRTARQAGALGAKLSGAGRGGNVICLVDPKAAESVADALKNAGAARVLISHVH